MPNPRVTVRVPQNIYDQLPTDERERSRLLLKLLHEHYNPTSAEAKLTDLQVRVEQLEHRIFGVS